MGSQPLTEYERRRLENIKRNEEMMAALKIPSGVNELSFATKRHRNENASNKKTILGKKPKSETPIVIRRSLRSLGLPPVTEASIEDLVSSTPVKENPKSPPRELGPVSMREAYIGTSPDHHQHLIDTVKCMMENAAPLSCSMEEKQLNKEGGSLNLASLVLRPENIRRIMTTGILNLKFFPSNDRSVIVAGNKLGAMAFWDVSCKQDGEEDGTYIYKPHTAPISGITIQPFNLSKVFTSSYDGTIRLMDVEKESFDLVYTSDDTIFCLSQQPQDALSLYFGEAEGEINVWDERAGKSSNSWVLHSQRINSIDFNPDNKNMMATSSTDGTACLWDLRSIDADRPKALKVVDHKKAVHSAYFSPSGHFLATTSASNKVGLLRGVDFMDVSMIAHDNLTGRWIPSFRAVWGWDDSYLFIGNMNRGLDVLSTNYRKMVTLQSPHLSAIPCRIAVHPLQVGMFAGATAGGQIYTWTSSTQDV